MWPAALTAGAIALYHDDDLDRDGICNVDAAIHVNVDDVFAGGSSPGIGDLMVGVGHVLRHAEVVAQQIEHLAALVGVADRHIAGRLDLQIDIGVELVQATASRQ